MNFSVLKLGIARKKAGAVLARQGVISEGEPLKKVGIILDDVQEELKVPFERLLNSLDLVSPNREMVFCLKDKPIEPGEDLLLFESKDLGWNGRITGKRVAEFASGKFDLLICYTRNNNQLARYLATVTQAGLKVGRQEGEEAIYDINISTPYGEVEVFIEELKKYLKILKRIK